MDGFEATRRIRATPSLRTVPVIALSASATDEVQGQSLEAGANAFLAKPIEHGALLAALDLHLNATARDPQPQMPMVSPPQDQIEILLELARAGRMRAISRHAKQIIEQDERYRPFAERLHQLASGYQSPAVLRLIEQHMEPKQAA